MREMKDSGIDWIGNIPKEWEVGKIKHHYEVTLGKMVQNEQIGLSETYENYLCAANIKWLGIDTSVNKQMWFAPYEKKQYLLSCGDVIVMEGGNAGTASVYMDELTPCYMQNSVNRCRSKGKYLNKYLFYWLYHVFYVGYISSICNKATIMHYTKEKLERTPILVLPIYEQEKIVSFLDAKCTEIDTLSADIQSEIDTLQEYKRSVITEAVTKGLDKNAPMKDSGLSWIGAMPSHWGLIRGKYCLKYLQKPVRQDDGVITCFRDGEVTLRSKRREEGFTMSDKEIGYQGIDKGDLVVHGMDGFAGAIGISDARGKASPVLNVLDTKENKKYFMYYLRSMAFGDVFLALATGIRVRSCDLRWNKLAELSYPIPPKDEQDAIVSYIDDKLQRADEIIKEKQEQMKVLSDFKKSVIYEYVTGKKEVPVI